jgi:hypothetical protein
MSDLERIERRMRFYQVHIHVDHGSSGGFEYFTTEDKAKQCVREHKQNNPNEDYPINIIEIKPTLAGIVSALNVYASHPDNG